MDGDLIGHVAVSLESPFQRREEQAQKPFRSHRNAEVLGGWPLGFYWHNVPTPINTSPSKNNDKRETQNQVLVPYPLFRTVRRW